MKNLNKNQIVRHSSSGFTLIEMLVVVAILGLLAAILIPVVNKTLERSASTRSLSNLRQIVTAAQTFAAEYRGLLPPVNLFQQLNAEDVPSWAPQYWGPNMNWKQILGPFVGDAEGLRAWDKHNDVFRCSRWEKSDFYNPSQFWFSGYGLNSRLERPRSNRQYMIHNFNENTQNPPLYLHTIPFPSSVRFRGHS